MAEVEIIDIHFAGVEYYLGRMYIPQCIVQYHVGGLDINDGF